MDITWLGHAAFRIKTGNSVILIDPFLKDSPTFKSAGLDFGAVTSDVTHVALTHGHDDHIADAEEILKSTGATLFAMVEIADFLEERGAKKVEAMNIGGTVKSGDFNLSLVNAVHSSSSNGRYFGNPAGIIITTSEGKTVLHMGDTDVFGDMALINEIYKPHIGLVPIGDRFTMGAKTAALACQRYFNFETVIPCHYGTFPIIDQTADAFVAAMKGQNVKVLKVGERFAA